MEVLFVLYKLKRLIYSSTLRKRYCRISRHSMFRSNEVKAGKKPLDAGGPLSPNLHYAGYMHVNYFHGNN